MNSNTPQQHKFVDFLFISIGWILCISITLTLAIIVLRLFGVLLESGIAVGGTGLMGDAGILNTIANWLGVVATALGAIFIIRQIRQADDHFSKEMSAAESRDLEHRFHDAAILLNSEKPSDRHSATLLLEEIAKRSPKHFAHRAVHALAESLTNVVPNDEDHIGLQARVSVLDTFGRLRFALEDYLNADIIKEVIRNCPPIRVSVETKFCENVDWTWLKLDFNATYVAITQSRLVQTKFHGQLRNSLFLADNDMAMAHFAQTGGTTNVSNCNLETVSLAGYNPDKGELRENWSMLQVSICKIDYIWRAPKYGMGIEFQQCWYEKHNPKQTDKHGFTYHTNSNDIFAIAEGVQTGTNKLGMPLYRRRTEND